MGSKEKEFLPQWRQATYSTVNSWPKAVMSTIIMLAIFYVNLKLWKLLILILFFFKASVIDIY